MLSQQVTVVAVRPDVCPQSVLLAPGRGTVLLTSTSAHCLGGAAGPCLPKFHMNKVLQSSWVHESSCLSQYLLKIIFPK